MSVQTNSQNQQNLSFLRHKPFLIQKPSRLVFTVQKGFCLWSYYGQFWIFWRTRHKSTRFLGLNAFSRRAEQFCTLGPSPYLNSFMDFLVQSGLILAQIAQGSKWTILEQNRLPLRQTRGFDGCQIHF